MWIKQQLNQLRLESDELQQQNRRGSMPLLDNDEAAMIQQWKPGIAVRKCHDESKGKQNAVQHGLRYRDTGR